MKATGERFIPNVGMGIEIEIEHMHRYHAVAPLLEGKAVLDAACGVGYGSQMIAKYAKHVTAIDIDEETITYARKNYGSENINYLQMSIEDMEFEDGAFDAIISFETIEHISERDQHRFLEKASRLLKKGGFLVISTPDLDAFLQKTQGEHYNPFHIKEYNRLGFEQLLGKYFPAVELYEQKQMVSSFIFREGQHQLNAAYEGAKGDYLIAVCGGEKTSLPIDSIFMPPEDIESSLYNAIRNLEGQVRQARETICDQEAQISGADAAIKDLEGQVRQAREMISSKDRQIMEASVAIDDLEKQVRHAKEVISEKDGQLDRAAKTINDLQRQIDQASSVIEAKDRQLALITETSNF